MKQYLLQDSMRKDAATQALGQFLPDLQASGFDDASVQRALMGTQDPNARAALLDRVSAERKALAETQYKGAQTQESKAKAAKEQMDAMAAGLGHLGGLAQSALANGDVNPQTVANLAFHAQRFGLDLPPYKMGDDASQYLRNLSGIATTAADQLSNQAKAYERAVQVRAQNMTANSAAQGHRVTAAAADPLNLLGINNGNFGGGFDVGTGNLGLPGQQQGGGAPPQRPPQGPPQSFDNSVGLSEKDRAAIQADSQASGFGAAQPAGPPNTATTYGSAPIVQGANAPGGAIDRSGLTGDELLATLPPAIANRLRQIKAGEIDMPSQNSRNPMANQMNLLLSQYDPQYSEPVYQARRKAYLYMAPGGQGGENVKNLATASNHLVSLADDFAQLNNTDFPLANAVGNTVRNQFGDRGLQNAMGKVAADVNGVAGEMAKVFRSSGMSVQEIDDWKKTYGNNLTPATMRGAVQAAVKLMEGRLQALADQQNAAFGTNKTWLDMLPPAAQANVQRVMALGDKDFTGGRPTPTGAPAATPQAAPQAASGAFKTMKTEGDTPPDPRSYPKGTIWVSEDGRTKLTNDGTTWQMNGGQ